jgi:hypothetical protein
MLDPSSSGALRVAAGGDLIVVIAGHEIRIELSVDELRHVAVALTIAADEREGITSPPEALAILYPTEGRA